MYGIGGNEVKGDASEAISDISQNRTLIIEKLTNNPPIKPEVVQGLTTVDEVFEHFGPKVDMGFTDSDGNTRNETLRFKNLGDFGIKGITNQSEFLQNLTAQTEQNQKMIKQLKTNKLLKKAIENKSSRTALINAMHALIKELEENK
jgi:hypothetical protein